MLGIFIVVRYCNKFGVFDHVLTELLKLLVRYFHSGLIYIRQYISVFVWISMAVYSVSLMCLIQ